MSKVDWSKAPSDAQIYSPEFGACNSAWYKVDAGKVFCWPDGYCEWSERDEMIGELIYRPKQEPKPWSGPEDGLPPLNTVCQMMDDAGCWIDVLIIANYDGYAHGWTSSEKDCFYSNEPNEFRPVKTTSEKRETAIRELMDIAQVDCRVTAARLVDAGFKREWV